MKWEERELIIILSVRRSTPKADCRCGICNGEVFLGEEALSVGLVDRMESKKARWIVCSLCEEIFTHPSAEDSPPHIQRYLYENRFSREIWEQ